jgi:hypothetical protein
MAAGATYVPIATQTLGSATTTYTFSSIPSTYTDLILVFGGIINSNTICRFNGDSGTNYSEHHIFSNNGAATIGGEVSISQIYIGDYINFPMQDGQSNTILHIQNYTNTNAYKSCLWRLNNGAGSKIQAGVGLWRNTAVISSILFGSDATNGMQSGSTITLYGIAAA